MPVEDRIRDGCLSSWRAEYDKARQAERRNTEANNDRRRGEKGGWRGLPFYTRVAIAGLLVFVMMYTGLGVLALVGGGVEVTEDGVQGIVFWALFMIPTLAVAVLAWRRPRTWPLLAPIWAMLMLLITAPLIPGALGTFNSFFDAGMLIPAIVSLMVAGVAGIVGFLQHRRGTTRNVSTAGERWALGATIALVIGLMVASGALHLTSIESSAMARKRRQSVSI